MTLSKDQLHAEIEARLERSLPDVELLACERIGSDRLRIFVDRRDGVDLAICERVTAELRDLLEDHAIEVSSPGPERPLVKPDHYRRFLGRKARVRTRQPRDGHRSFTGELVGASDDEVTVAADTGVVAIPYGEIARGNLIASGDGASAEQGGGQG